MFLLCLYLKGKETPFRLELDTKREVFAARLRGVMLVGCIASHASCLLLPQPLDKGPVLID